MFYFFDTKQGSENARYFKGHLFEDLLRQYLQASGYNVEIERIKHASLEYDLLGTHRLDKRQVVGEAKAHTQTISAQQVAAFVGKALPYLHREPPWAAIFLSTSTITPDARDYLDNLERTTPHRITWQAGGELETQVREVLQLPSHDEAQHLSARTIPAPSGQHILHTDLGTFLVITGAPASGSFDDRFLLISATGDVVKSSPLLEQIPAHLQPFEDLLPVTTSGDNESTSSYLSRPREIPEGLQVATSWTDYRRPAGQEFFIGRATTLADLEESLLECAQAPVLEIKSRSGVGKSSLLAVLRDRLLNLGHHVALHDARDVQSPSDVLRILQTFAKPEGSVPTFEGLPRVLSDLTKRLGDNKAIFMVDQLESSFARPEVFNAYEYIALSACRQEGAVFFVYSRKDDLLTTHDDLLVNLGRLRSHAKSFAIDDFTRDEASELIKRAVEELEARPSSRILAQVLEFAQGFPWLLKRTMAHLSSLLTSGIKQEELISSGLHLEDLFEEELSGLDEHERGYLTRLAGLLPATYHALSRRFEGDPLLPSMLASLTERRILRLASGTYDIYNDVFKDYLLYERLPESGHADVYRLGLVAVVEGYRAIGSRASFSPEDLAGRVGRSLGSTYNLLREMRLAGLVSRKAGTWAVSEVARQYEHQGRLGEYVRQSVLKNRAVSDLVLEVERSNGLPKDAVARWLRSKFPFVEAKRTVWRTYSNRLLDWCKRLLLLELGDDAVLRVVDRDHEELVAELGNLAISGRGSRPMDAAFVPSIPFSTATRVLRKLHASDLDRDRLTRSEQTALRELIKVGAVDKDSAGSLTAKESQEAFEMRMHTMMSGPPYSTYWDLLIQGVPWPEAMRQSFSLGQLAESTLVGLGKRTANWGRNLGFLPASRLRFKRSKQAGKSSFGGMQSATLESGGRQGSLWDDGD